LAVAPKSNAVYSAWKSVRSVVQQGGSLAVPMHLRNAPTGLMKRMGMGAGYRYAHDEADGYAAGETYLPDEVVGTRFYEPQPRGLEARIAERLAELRRRDDEAQSAPHTGKPESPNKPR
jgi:putative ATPase